MGIRKNSTEEYKEKVFKKYGDKVNILSEYNGGTSPIDFVYYCEEHGEIYKTINAKNILAKSFSPCGECTREIQSKKAKSSLKYDKSYQYNRLVDYVTSKGGKVITKEWTTAKSIYEIDCGNPNHPNFFVTADSLINKPQWCPYCCGRKGNFENEIKDIIHSKNGELLSKYINSNTHVKVQCNKHNYIWDIMPLNIKKGRWCPVCSMVYSEKVVYDYLINNNYQIKVQYGFDDLVGKNNEKLKYDIAILNKFDKLIGLIEVDDVEHRYNTKQPRRIEARNRDKQKDRYCEENNIKLFRLQFYNNNKEFLNYNWYYKYIKNSLCNFLDALK